MDLSSLTDAGGDFLTTANKLLSQGAQAYQTVTGATKPQQTAQQVAAGSTAPAPMNWKPWAIGGAIFAGVLALVFMLSGKKN